MHAQQATREAEMQQMALAETLQQALAQLGIELTPSRPTPLVTPLPEGALLQGPAVATLQVALSLAVLAGGQARPPACIVHTALRTVPCGIAGGVATTPPAVRQSVFSAQQLAVVAASLSKLPNPRQSQHWAAAEAAAARAAAIEAGAQPHDQHQHQQQEQRRLQYESRQQLEEREAAERRQRASCEAAEAERQRRRASLRASHEQRQASGGGQSGAASRGQQLSGFTVYTNSMQSEGEEGAGAGASADDGEVAHQPRARRSHAGLRHSASAPASAGERDSQGSGVQWRSISSAALSSRSRSSEPGAAAADHADTAAAHPQQRGSRASSQHQQRASLRCSLDAAAASEADDRLQQHARQLSKLVLPGLDASQLDSLVRIGASQASPDPHAHVVVPSSVEVLQQLLPPGWQAAVGAQWDSGINPLRSEPEAEMLLRELRAEWQRKGAGAGAPRPASRPASRPGSRPGSRRASQDGRPPLAASTVAAPARPEAPAGGRGRRAGGEPLGLLQVPVFDGKVPGAGTWVR